MGFTQYGYVLQLFFSIFENNLIWITHVDYYHDFIMFTILDTGSESYLHGHIMSSKSVVFIDFH